MYILCTVIFSMWWMSIYKYIIARQTLFTTPKHYLLWCPKRCISKTSSWKIWGWNDHAWHLVNGAHMVLTSSESFFNHRNIKLATRFGTKCPQWELQLMMQLNWDRLGSQIPVTSVTMQCLGVDVTSLILASGFVPLSQAFCYCAFSPNCLPPEIHGFFIKLLYRVHINLPYCIALHLRTLENLNQM